MLSFLVHRFAYLLLILLGVTLIVFLMLRIIPGDPVEIMLGVASSVQDTQDLRAKLGLDRSYPVQYLLYLKNLAHGDFGVSFRSGSPVIQEIFPRLLATVELSLSALFIAGFAGLTAGVISSVRQQSFYDYVSMFLSLVGVSMPIFWLGLMLLYLFGVKFPLLPIMGQLTPGLEIKTITGIVILDVLLQWNFKALLDALGHLLLPAVTLATVPMALVARISRSSMLEVLNQDYIKTARAKGLSEFVVTLRHALRNALLPVVTVLGLNLGVLLGGAVIIENIFAWPGLGRFVVTSLFARDYPAVQSCALIFATLMILINLLVDISYFFLDPRIRIHE